jgi:hypothetical protein
MGMDRLSRDAGVPSSKARKRRPLGRTLLVRLSLIDRGTDAADSFGRAGSASVETARLPLKAGLAATAERR